MVAPPRVRPGVGSGCLRTTIPAIGCRSAVRDRAGFVDRGGSGSHWNFVHPNVRYPVTISGNLGTDAKRYQEREVARAIAESKTSKS